MAAPRVTQQFLENIRGDEAVIPHGPRVTQQFIEVIRSIDSAPPPGGGRSSLLPLMGAG